MPIQITNISDVFKKRIQSSLVNKSSIVFLIDGTTYSINYDDPLIAKDGPSTLIGANGQSYEPYFISIGDAITKILQDNNLISANNTSIDIQLIDLPILDSSKIIAFGLFDLAPYYSNISAIKLKNCKCLISDFPSYSKYNRGPSSDSHTIGITDFIVKGELYLSDYSSGILLSNIFARVENFDAEGYQCSTVDANTISSILPIKQGSQETPINHILTRVGQTPTLDNFRFTTYSLDYLKDSKLKDSDTFSCIKTRVSRFITDCPTVLTGTYQRSIFTGCSKLEIVDLRNESKNWGRCNSTYGFDAKRGILSLIVDNCENLTEFVFPYRIINADSFMSALQPVDRYVDKNRPFLFRRCPNLKSVVFPADLSSDYASGYLLECLIDIDHLNSPIEEITVPGHLQSIGRFIEDEEYRKDVLVSSHIGVRFNNLKRVIIDTSEGDELDEDSVRATLQMYMDNPDQVTIEKISICHLR